MPAPVYNRVVPRLALKPDSSFFRKIALGAVGSRHVSAALGELGHVAAELERGSTDTRLWKEVKRKRVRIPDLVCLRCGLRVESRAKTDPNISMSHSVTDAERAWDYGMVDEDCVAFAVCTAAQEEDWSTGRLVSEWSDWRERAWVRWQPVGRINYFRVADLRTTPPTSSITKGVTEGSETALAWDARFSTRRGTVETADRTSVSIRRNADGHVYTWRITEGLQIRVVRGEGVEENQVIACNVPPITPARMRCAGQLPEGHIRRLIGSKERTQRFTGVKLARLLLADGHLGDAAAMLSDREEDMYIRLEAAAYLCSVGGQAAPEQFEPFLRSGDAQTQLEAAITVAEAGTAEATGLLAGILEDDRNPFFLRSAAAWGLGRRRGGDAARRLIRAFSDVDLAIREEALVAVASLGGTAIPALLSGLRQTDADVAAGCAEALRRQRDALDEETLESLAGQLRNDPSQWAVWLVGHLPQQRVAPALADLPKDEPELHYAITLLWAFIESWVARHWEPILSPPPVTA